LQGGLQEKDVGFSGVLHYLLEHAVTRACVLVDHA